MLLPPRIQMLLCREYNESPRCVPAMGALRLSIHAPGDLNVTQKPYLARLTAHFSTDSSRLIRLISALRVRNFAAGKINYFATLDRGAL
jgi:hypothetical protein